MKRPEFYKFLCGFLAGAGVVHANMGFAIAAGMFDEPRYLGHTSALSSATSGGEKHRCRF